MKLFDKTVEVLEQAINLRSKRNSITAGNIANVDTPGYRPRDIDFNRLMKQYMEPQQKSDLSVTHRNHIVLQDRGNEVEDRHCDMVTLSGAHGEPASLSTTDPGHYRTAVQEEEDTDIKFSTERGVPNSIDLDREMAKLSANNLQYQAAVSALIKKFEGLVTAITEGGKQ